MFFTTFALVDIQVSSPDLVGRTGEYYSGAPGKAEFNPVTASKEALDAGKAKKLWELSCKLVRVSNL